MDPTALTELHFGRADLVGLPRTLQLRENYSTGENDEKEKEVQQGIQGGRRSTSH
jgi:hypothetical protein